ncbi:PAAR domain-containing protein [Epibacterium ulvae]|uniref:PAAR domain-containing protein n=1 Tax=Epibacterium ulvae TaxID=1156985 RepID=UPI0024901F12|nr:PAAR domain-containing protein [Epibacterium ulvae]
MAKAARKGDICTGHGLFPPRPCVAGSPNVEIENQAALRQGDGWAAHCDPIPVCHAGTQAGGSSSVFINGKPAARVGDAVSCGGSVASGASSVFIGG